MYVKLCLAVSWRDLSHTWHADRQPLLISLQGIVLM